MIDFEDACRRTADLARPLPGEVLPLADAAGRVLAAPVVARRTAPAHDTSAMDGYAVRSADVETGSARLRIIAEAFAGDALRPAPLASGDCVRIFTGAPVPPGTDRVVIQEIVRREGDIAVLERPLGGALHIRQAGSDFRLGDVLLEAGAVLTPQAIVAAAAADLDRVEVVARPRVSILSTGDELAEPGQAAARPGAIPDSVSLGVAAIAAAWGATVSARRRVADDVKQLEVAARAALEEADVVVITGGASVGERDFAKSAFEPLGLEMVFAKVAIKPGKPVWLGRVGDKIVLGLPGNPTAALVTARLFLAPLLAGLGGRRPDAALEWRCDQLTAPIQACADRETFCRGSASPDGVTPLDNQDSASQRTLAWANVLIRQRPGVSRSGVQVATLLF
ncbi:MAG: molybdopterin molybdenumtransferase MoeA [Phenylobacterium sp.]|uniref:molybdopterin molybdotransferase MoeA n=1 Tax=Phenylobacterium sp. TaxID=1871053 RepID=UPI0025D7A1B7|nr:molybdopterin molybdotransferase MoeA [Phenylobacterium sp.]MBI1197928.1 molybdopterin molybdenumtransferase MoeA [Phenylobacterium sp.]